MGKESEGRCSGKDGSEPSGTAGGLMRLAGESRQKVGRRSVDGEVLMEKFGQGGGGFPLGCLFP